MTKKQKKYLVVGWAVVAGILAWRYYNTRKALAEYNQMHPTRTDTVVVQPLVYNDGPGYF